MLVGPAKKYKSPKSSRTVWVYWSIPRVKVTVLWAKSTLMFTVSPKWNCHPFFYLKNYHFWLWVKTRIMMVPWKSWSVGCTHLIDSICSFSNSVTAQKIVIFNNVQNCNSHPNTFVSWLLFDFYWYLVIFLCYRTFKQINRITTCK